MVALLVHVIVAAASRHQVWALVVDVTRESAVDRARGCVVKRLLEAIAVDARIAGNAEQPLVRICKVNDVARLSAHVRPNACPRVQHDIDSTD